MKKMIEVLLDSKSAYTADGHVLFEVSKMRDYGRLSRRDRDELIAGARVEVAPYKRDPADFVLWKPSPSDLPGWDSPWGRGRPGWHLECSAMSEVHLGETFDIHGGGLDLIFPHHENEIAQSVCAHGGKPFVKYWLHNGFVTVNGAKMAKSEGNFVTIRDVLKDAPGEAARFAMLTAHYRDPLDWTAERLAEAKRALDRFYLALRSVEDVSAEGQGAKARGALDDDLNTPLALAALHEDLAALNKAQTRAEKARLKGALLDSGKLLGILQQDPERWLNPLRPDQGDVLAEVQVRPTIQKIVVKTLETKAGASVSLSMRVMNPRIDALVAKRNEARKARDFALADKIRTDLASEGVILEDKPDGTTEWRRKG